MPCFFMKTEIVQKLDNVSDPLYPITTYLSLSFISGFSGSSIDMSPSHRNVAHDTSTSVGRSTFFKSASSLDLSSLGNAEYDNGRRAGGRDFQGFWILLFQPVEHESAKSVGSYLAVC